MRSIAAAAGVDAALVHHYFGTKDGLLLSALRPDTPEELAQLIGGGFDGLGERFLRLTLKVYGYDYPGGWGTMIGLLRSASAHADAARLLRESFEHGGIGRLVEALGVPQPRLRAALVGAELVGLTMARHVVRLEPLASADPESLIAWYAPTLDRYLTGPLAGDEDRKLGSELRASSPSTRACRPAS